VKPARFEYCAPTSLGEALGLLAELGPDGAVLAGGMTLGPMLNLRLLRPRAVVDIGRIGALRSLELRDGTLRTGSTVVQSDALDSPLVRAAAPLLALALPWVGHFQTRNRGTLGGSVAHADPSAEIPLCLVTLNGTVVLRSQRRERRVAARAFFQGALATARRPDELVTGLEWPHAPHDAGHAFAEVAQRHGDFAIAAVACQVRLAGDRLVRLALGLGGVGERPTAIDTEPFLDRPLDGEMLRELARYAAHAIDPIEDQLGNAEFRRALAEALVLRVVPAAIADARRSMEK
jgi:2-furoyl-CoA dehydrogenase FAD binding subunit